jgi:hypothetical protein
MAARLLGSPAFYVGAAAPQETGTQECQRLTRRHPDVVGQGLADEGAALGLESGVGRPLDATGPLELFRVVYVTPKPELGAIGEYFERRALADVREDLPVGPGRLQSTGPQAPRHPRVQGRQQPPGDHVSLERALGLEHGDARPLEPGSAASGTRDTPRDPRRRGTRGAP